jgi:myo-inositol-1(or 4)-monophosphatase
MLKATLLQATQAGADQLQHFFSREFAVSHKEGINNLVTEADHAAEKAIIDVIKAAHPDHFIVSEESGHLVTDSNIKWIIDPIDGTVNFANGIPICCVSIGVEKDGELLLGAVFNPLMDELFVAEKGEGATLNGKKIAVSNKAELQTSCLVTGFPYQYLDIPLGPLQLFEHLLRRGIPVRRLGSAPSTCAGWPPGALMGFTSTSCRPGTVRRAR